MGDPAEDYKHHRYSIVNIERVKKLFRGELPKSTFNWYIKRRHVLQWGGMSDGFDWYELKDKASYELLKFFVEIGYPISISSKNTWLLDYHTGGRYAEEAAPYWDLFREGGKNGTIHWKSSIISLDEEKLKTVEAGVGSPRLRFQLMEELAKVGVVTTFRFRPFILGISADYPYSDQSYQQLDEIFKLAADSGCYSATTEFLCIESRTEKAAAERFQKIGQVAGFGDNLIRWYVDNSMKKTGLLRLNYDLKRPYIDAQFELADKYGLKMFVSDAHHKEKSYHAGCCGLPEVGPLSNSFKGHFAQAILIAKKNGAVHWRDIEEEARWLKNIPFAQKEGFNVGDTRALADMQYLTMYEYLMNQWDNPNSFIGPNRYFGGACVAATERDEDGHIVYLYNKPFIENRIIVHSTQELQEQLVAQGTDWMQDGENLGHVAYPVFVNGYKAPWTELKQTLRALTAARITFTLFCDAETQALSQEAFPDNDYEVVPEMAFTETLSLAEYIGGAVEAMGFPKFWLLNPDAYTEFVKDSQAISARAWMSAREAEFVEGKMTWNDKAVILRTEARPEGMLE